MCEGDTIRFDIQFSAGDKSNLEFFHDGEKVQENDEDGVRITFANDVASLTIQGSAFTCLRDHTGFSRQIRTKLRD